ncbi:hypothetical protein B5X24_HaOG215778 [Helicoverpa armigera]|nr:hypothetical protein B5X24_HaOG215778 [Helicoverpa armigera]
MGFCDCCVPPKESREPIRYDPNFNGPIHNRSCTDVLWLILFILFLGVWGYVGYYGMTHGSVQKLLAPIDSTGKRCGLDSGLIDKPYLVFFDISKCLSPGTPIVGCPTPQVCVKQCPTETKIFDKEMTESNFLQYRPSMVCTADINVNTLTYAQARDYITQNKCASYVLQSQAVMGRCFVNIDELRDFIENNTMSTDQVISQLVNLVQFQEKNRKCLGSMLSAQIVQDLVQSRWYLLGALIVVVFICFLYILLLRWVVGPVVWTSIVGLIGLMGFCVYLCYKNYAYYKENPGTLHQTTNLKGYAESIFSKPSTWLVILIAVAVLLLILVLVVIFLRGRITIAIALIREGSKAVSAIKSTIFFPIFPWILQCFVIAYGVLVLMYLLSIGESAFKIVNFKNDTCTCDNGIYNADNIPCDPVQFMTSCRDQNTGGACSLATCHFTGLDSPNSVVYLHLANLLGFFWTMFFISGVSDMMLASTFSTWYWTFQKRDLPFFTLTSGIFRTLRYHMGTVALGALIIAIVRVIRVILEYIDQKIKKFDNAASNPRNLRIHRPEDKEVRQRVHSVHHVLLQVLLLVPGELPQVHQQECVYNVRGPRRSVATYLICTIFFNVYAMAVDTLFLCFLEDCERNDGSPEKPYFMSKNLMKILGKRNKQL